jgi:hypothetical protein
MAGSPDRGSGGARPSRRRLRSIAEIKAELDAILAEYERLRLAGGQAPKKKPAKLEDTASGAGQD